MKNHIIFKFIAVLLCAASLLGVIGTAAGAFALTETGLDSKTVAQVREQRIQESGQSFALEAALRYASENLGNCPTEFTDSRYGYNWPDDYFEYGKYSYSLLDAEGNVVYSSGEAPADGAVHSFPVSGQYPHVVSTETESERAARAESEYAFRITIIPIEDTYTVTDALPPEGAQAAYAALYDPYETPIYEVFNEDGAGFLYYNADGNVTYTGFFRNNQQNLSRYTIAGALFRDAEGNVLYQVSCKDGVGTVSLGDNGAFIFTSVPPVSEPEPTVPETEPPVTEPVETEPAAPDRVIPIYYVALYDSTDEKIYRDRGTESVGFLSLNADGKLVFRGFDQIEEPLPESTVITGAYFCEPDDEIIYEVYNDEGIGTLSYTEHGQLIFAFTEPALSLLSAEDEEETEAAAEPEETEEAEETEATEAPSSASAVPEETTLTTEPTGETVETTQATETMDATEVTEAAEATALPTEPPVTQAATLPPETAAPTEPLLINGKALEEYQIETDTYFDSQLQEPVIVRYVYTPMPEYTVELYLAPDALRYDAAYTLLQIVQDYSGYLFPALIACLLVFAICAVYLCCSAGRKPKSEEVHAGGLNCLPLDLYTVLICIGVALAVEIIAETAMYRMDENFLFCCGLIVAAAFLACLVFVAFFFALAAQFKTPGGYWWRNTLCVRFVMLFMRFGVWLERFLAQKCFPFLGRALKWTWSVVILGCFRLWQKFADWFVCFLRRFFGKLYNLLHRFFSLLPITWQWLIVGFAVLFLLLVTVAGRYDVGILLSILFALVVILYGAHCFGVLGESTRRMSGGDLDTKVDDKLLLGCFKDFAEDLNDLADVAVVAAQKQLKSERMKTELITNVSHDIKTPLTSIINYVDLLQKPHNEEQEAQYLEVLSRQSLRLKKLIEDLMEMSKASTGNMAVEITTVDAVESVNQALGEFSDKLNAAQLTPMFRHTESSVAMQADGKLVWRVLSNVLSNAVKYAMPGTRLYIDLMELEGKVVISLKNISREELNMDAEELMERFVRGDDSRNTEGSGLGLNIAKSLMELQKGQLQLLVDGDLFKVTLIFPGV